jgi:transposase
METIYIGMDLHKSTSSFCVMDKDGTVLQEKRVPTTRESTTRFIKSFGKKQHLSLAMESVSQCWTYVDHFEELSVETHVAHPRKLKAIATATSKTDKLDAKVLADHLRTNHLPEAYLPSRKVRGWKEMVRSRSALVNLRTQTKNRVHSVLFKNGLSSPFTSLFTKRGIVWLKGLEMEDHFKFSIDKYLSVIEHLDSQIKEMEKTIQQTIEETKEMKLLKTIPGVGDIFAATFMAEIGDINRFKSYRQLQAYAGLVPWVRNSGGKEWSGHLTKQGSRWLRYAAVEVAVATARTRISSDVKDYYLKIQKNKNSKTAVVATARKLLAIVWSVLKNEREFKARYPAI